MIEQELLMCTAADLATRNSAAKSARKRRAADTEASSASESTPPSRDSMESMDGTREIPSDPAVRTGDPPESDSRGCEGCDLLGRSCLVMRHGDYAGQPPLEAVITDKATSFPFARFPLNARSGWLTCWLAG